jgi:hypothetical protein
MPLESKSAVLKAFRSYGSEAKQDGRTAGDAKGRRGWCEVKEVRVDGNPLGDR